MEAVKGSVPQSWVPVDPAAEAARQAAKRAQVEAAAALAAKRMAAKRAVKMVPPKRICGDGKLAGKGEDCDDGNTAAGDGCSKTCTIETGWRCDYNFVGETSICHQPTTPVVGFTDSDDKYRKVVEGGTVTIPLFRTNDNNTVSTVSYRTLEGSATSTGTGNTYDYVSREGVLTFGAGERSAQLEVVTTQQRWLLSSRGPTLS